jgi:hypothetical protein
MDYSTEDSDQYIEDHESYPEE